MLASKISVVVLVALFCVLAVFGTVPLVGAQTEVERLKGQINERNTRLQDIEKEIAAYKLELQKVGSEKNTLQNAINQLELERKKVNADIAYTQNKIGATDLEINKLNLEIKTTEKSINLNEIAIAETIRKLDELDGQTLIEALLVHKNIAELWDSVAQLDQVRAVMRDTLKSLSSQKVLLEQKQGSEFTKRQELVGLKNKYQDQNSVLTNNRTEKSQLLTATKNEEAAYQKMLKDRETARDKLLKELRDFESQLQFILDPNTVPPKGTPVFSWPIENIVITQLFGGTEFAKQNASVYGGRPYHPGVDFGAPRGTPIMAPLSGVVRATGDTDLVAGCYSWGKWTLIDHANGLATLYAHQSVVSVSPGQSVKTGEIIGYVGNTGYSTGPHLHFTVYAKAGVSIRKFSEIKAVTSCGAATTPVAATDAYIDPMVYFPPR